MKKVVITGASGFVGKALVQKLIVEGVLVYAIVKNESKLSDILHPNLIIIESELKNYRNLYQKIKDDIDVFYHFAWEGTFGESFKDYHMQLRNAAYAGDALMCAVEIGCKKFVYAGTIVELEVRRYIGMDECDPRFSCIYGTGKLAGAMLCKTLAYQYGMNMNIAIVASTFGEGDYSKRIHNVLLNDLDRGKSPRLIEGHNLYDWVYIDDTVEAFRKIGEKGKKGKTYYIGNRTMRTFEELVTETRDIVNPKIELSFGELKDTTVTDYSMVDVDALYVDTGFECKANFKESILKTAKWVKTLTW